jgi:hypothetical protein
MCWNAEVSFSTFFIGTVLNILLVFSINRRSVRALAFFWQWVLFMQVFEGIFWISNPNGAWSHFATLAANLNSMLQPIVLTVVLLLTQSFPDKDRYIHASDLYNLVPYKNKVYAHIGIVSYISYLLFRFLEGDLVPNTLTPANGCYHLNLIWHSTLKYTGVVYFALLIAGYLLLLRPFNFMIIVLGYVVTIFFISSFIYPCGMASMWCWFSVSSPLVTYFAWKFTENTEYLVRRNL